MADKNSIQISSSLMVNAEDAPMDIRTRVGTESEIMSIQRPYIGMIVYVVDTGMRFEVTKLKDIKNGFTIVKNGAVAEYKELFNTSDFAKQVDLDATDEEVDTAQADIVDLQAALAALLNPYKAPVAVAKLVCTPEDAVAEKGGVINIAAIQVAIAKGSHNITKIEFIVNGVPEKILVDDIADGGTFTCTFNNALQLVNEINEDYFKVEITDASNNILNINTKAIKFVYPYYFGVVDENAEIDSNIINGLNKAIKEKQDLTYDYSTNNQRMVIAYPKEYGSLERIIEMNGFNIRPSFDVKEVSIMCEDRTSQEYYIYYNNASTVSNYNITFKY